MKRVIIFTFLVLLLTSLVSASGMEELANDLDQFEGMRVPHFAEFVFGDSSMNLHVTKNDGQTAIIGIETNEGVVETVGLDPISEPDLEVYTTEAKINEISTSSNPLLSLKQAINNKEIDYQANGFWNKLKFYFIDLFSKFSNDDTDTKTIPAVEQVVESVEENITQIEEEIEVVEEIIEDVIENISDSNVTIDTISILNESENETIEDSELEEEIVEEPEEEPEEEIIEEDDTEVVKFIDGGFNRDEVTISVGDMIIWENLREGTLYKAMLIGTKAHTNIKSAILVTGESYNWTFTEADEYVFVDGIITTQSMKVIVEE